MFKTSNLSFAAFLTLTKKLRFIAIEVNSQTGNADICFEDPAIVGRDLELAFLNSEPDTFVAPHDYHQALKNLRGSITRTIARQKAVRRG
jgi:hypothetical protein